jgi:hypothetical protein
VSINPETGRITETPDAGYEGPDAFAYTVCDGTGGCDTATVAVDVTAPPVKGVVLPANRPPTFADAPGNRHQEIDVGGRPAPLQATDADGDSLTWPSSPAPSRPA